MKILILISIVHLSFFSEGDDRQNKPDKSTDPGKKFIMREEGYEIIPNSYNMPILNGASQNMEKMVVVKADSSVHFHLRVKKESYLIP